MIATDEEREEEKVEAWLKEGNNPTTLIKMGQCALCFAKITSHSSVPTCLGVRTCNGCESMFERTIGNKWVKRDIIRWAEKLRVEDNKPFVDEEDDEDLDLIVDAFEERILEDA